jgi:L-alanine-DL-glutamate epimerase-like enolase superfamily enzyme
MKITRIETLTCSSYRSATWVQIHTDEGLVGLGDTNFYEGRAATFIRETAAPYLLGQDPRLVERHHRKLRTGRM